MKTPKEMEKPKKEKCKVCCCTCIHQKKLMCHPWNKEFGKGSILKSCGFICDATFEDDSNKGTVGFMDRKHSLCELWFPKKKKARFHTSGILKEFFK